MLDKLLKKDKEMVGEKAIDAFMEHLATNYPNLHKIMLEKKAVITCEQLKQTLNESGLGQKITINSVETSGGAVRFRLSVKKLFLKMNATVCLEKIEPEINGKKQLVHFIFGYGSYENKNILLKFCDSITKIIADFFISKAITATSGSIRVMQTETKNRYCADISGLPWVKALTKPLAVVNIIPLDLIQFDKCFAVTERGLEIGVGVKGVEG